jgi:flagellar biosynthesis component FlhA
VAKTANGLCLSQRAEETIPVEKKLTLEDLVASIQGDLLAIRRDMATKQDIGDLREEVATKHDLAALRDEMISRFATHSELQAIEDRLLEEMVKIKYAKEIDELRARVKRVEQELGIGRTAI